MFYIWKADGKSVEFITLFFSLLAIATKHLVKREKIGTLIERAKEKALHRYIHLHKLCVRNFSVKHIKWCRIVQMGWICASSSWKMIFKHETLIGNIAWGKNLRELIVFDVALAKAGRLISAIGVLVHVSFGRSYSHYTCMRCSWELASNRITV